MAADESLIQPGERVGDLQIVEHLGVTGMADRYLARDSQGRDWMLGVVGAQHPDLTERIRAQHLERVRHRNLATVERVVEVGRMPGLVTDVIRGPTLRAWIERGGYSPEQALQLFRGLVEGIGAAHKAGLVHRDLRPENILVEGTATPVARVLDLGVASAMFELVTGGRSVTTSGTTVGKPHYWAPERARRPQAADARSDLFSLGCILYELLAGRGPFAGLNLYDCYHATLEENYLPLEQRAPTVSPAAIAVVHALLRADPDKRIQTCTELLERLDPFTLTDEHVPERAPTPVPVGPRESSARSIVPVVAGAVGLALLAAGAWYLFARG